MYPKYLLVLLILLLGEPVAAQVNTDQKYPLPRRALSLRKLLVKLNEAGAELSYRPDHIPPLVLNSPGGHRTVASWLRFLLRDTELIFEQTLAGYIIYPDPDLSSRQFSIYGTISDAGSGERLIAATVRDSTGGGMLSNEYGFYSLSLPGGRRRIEFSYVGYAPVQLDLVLRGDTTINLALHPAGNLPEIIVTPTPEGVNEVHLTETRTSIGPEQTRQAGGLGGLADPLRLARLLPGVATGPDGTGGIFIRGSESGHNLVLLDGVPVYSLDHAAGLISIFNNEAIRRVDIYKDGLPSRFGGRIGGVVDVHIREGNMYDFQTTVGADLLTTGVTAEGPLTRGKSSFLVTARTFWGGELLRRFSERAKAAKGRTGLMDYQVYDINLKVNQRVGRRGHVYFSLFNGVDNYANDAFSSRVITTLPDESTVLPFESRIARDEKLRWGNTVGALRYNHVFSEKFFGNFRLSYSDLKVDASVEVSDSLLQMPNATVASGEVFSGRYGSDIQQLGLAFDGQIELNSGHHLRFGGEGNVHQFIPQFISGDVALIRHPTLDQVRSTATLRPLQLSLYSSYSGNYGEIRYRFGLRTQAWRNGKMFFHLSPRLLLAGRLGKKAGWRVTYDQLVQPIHLITTSGINLPTNFWVPATEEFGPSTSHQVAVQLTHRVSRDLNLVTAAYYRDIRDLARFTEVGSDWQQNLSKGNGTAKGVEVTLNRTRGVISGWLNYSLTRSTRQFDTLINIGRPFVFRYERRHAAKAFVRYQPRPGFSLSASFRLGTGIAFSPNEVTLLLADPATAENPETLVIDLTGEKNSVRLPADHRLDLNAHFTFRGKNNPLLVHNLSLGIHNVYNRHNPIYYEVESNYVGRGGELFNDRRYKQIFLPGFLPMLSYRLSIRSRQVN